MTQIIGPHFSSLPSRKPGLNLMKKASLPLPSVRSLSSRCSPRIFASSGNVGMFGKHCHNTARKKMQVICKATRKNEIGRVNFVKDFRRDNVLPRALSQRQDETCWAFAFAYALASKYNMQMKPKVPVEISVQQLVDIFNHHMGEFELWHPLSWLNQHHWMKATSLTTSERYPSYTGVPSTPKALGAAECLFKFPEIRIMVNSTEEQIECTLLEQPLISCIHILVQDRFAYFKSGKSVFRGAKSPFGIDYTVAGPHFVLLVGYGKTEEGEEVLLYLNSFGENWGEDGFGLISKRYAIDTLGMASFLMMMPEKLTICN